MFMKKLYVFMTALLAMFANNANADTKIIYQDNYSSAEASKANWTDNRSNAAIDFITTPDGNYMQFNLGLNGNNFNGTRFSSIWGSTPWTDVTIPESGYKMEVSFNFEAFGNNSSNAAQRNHEIAIISAKESEDQENQTINDVLAGYWGTAGSTNVTINAGRSNEKVVDVFPNYLFKLTQIKTGDAAGEGGYVGNGSCGFTINNETDEVRVTQGVWYKLTLEVVGQTVKYDITDISGTPLKSGTYTLADGADNRIGGMVLYGARYYSKTNVGLNLQITMESDEDVANAPVVTLNKVLGNDRLYKASFADGETLHYILPGETQEQTVDYWDAEDDNQNPGNMMLTCTKSGTLKTWTTKNEAKSEEINIEVTTGWIKLVDPVVAIASVSEGYGKSFRVTFNDAAPEHLLPVNAAITYSIDGVDKGLVQNNMVTMEGQGTLVVTVNQVPASEGAPEYYNRSSVTIQNNVEYQVAMETSYINWDDTHFANNPAWEAGKLEDSNMSHWAGHWQEANKYDKEEQDKIKENPDYIPVPTQNPVKVYRTDGSYDLPIYTLVNDEAGANYAKELLPLIPNTARANVAILLEEGLFANTTSYNNLELTFDQKWATDDAAKPNFIEIRRTNNYDRYDKGPGRHITDIVETTKTDYSLYRLDTAIHSARVFTYKGFTPATGIEAIQTVKAAENAPIYNLNGVRVANAAQKGIYIQNGKKFVVK